MCLQFFEQQKAWSEARQTCQEQGGFLAWIEDKSHHSLINAFLLSNYYLLKNDFFHIGLFRMTPNEAISWTRGINSEYRGNPLLRPEKEHFSAKTGSTRVFGDTDDALEPFLCRLH